MGFLNALNSYAHKSELRESKDEIVFGEIVRGLSHHGWACHQVVAHGDRQQAGFKVPGHDVLAAVYVVVDRRTGSGAISQSLGSKTTIGLAAEMRNKVSDPDDLAAMWRADLANLFKVPVNGEVRVNHQLNKVIARTNHLIDLDNYVQGTTVDASQLVPWLLQQVDNLAAHLRPPQEGLNTLHHALTRDVVRPRVSPTTPAPGVLGGKMLAYDYPLLGLMWTMLMVFLWVAWIILLLRIFSDIFRSHDMGGWAKALWSIFVIVFPFLGVFVYLIARGGGMVERDVKARPGVGGRVPGLRAPDRRHLGQHRRRAGQAGPAPRQRGPDAPRSSRPRRPPSSPETHRRRAGAAPPGPHCGTSRHESEHHMSDARPNILVIWGDDIGQSNLSCYSDGVMGYRTPNIDRIADEGARFTDYYGEQSCTAGRAAFITGQNPYRTGLTKVGMPGADIGLRRRGPDHRHRPQGPGLRHRPVRQEPPRRPRRVPADRPRVRRVLRQPVPPQRRGGARATGLPDRRGHPRLPRAVRSPGRDPVVGQPRRHPAHRGHRSADQEADGDLRRGVPRRGDRLHPPPERRRHPVLPVVQLDPHALPHPHQGGEQGAGRSVAVRATTTPCSTTTTSWATCWRSSTSSGSPRTPSSSTPPTTGPT